MPQREMSHLLISPKEKSRTCECLPRRNATCAPFSLRVFGMCWIPHQTWNMCRFLHKETRPPLKSAPNPILPGEIQASYIFLGRIVHVLHFTLGENNKCRNANCDLLIAPGRNPAHACSPREKCNMGAFPLGKIRMCWNSHKAK